MCAGLMLWCFAGSKRWQQAAQGIWSLMRSLKACGWLDDNTAPGSCLAWELQTVSHTRSSIYCVHPMHLTDGLVHLT